MSFIINVVKKHLYTILVFSFSIIIFIVTWLPIYSKVLNKPPNTYYPYIHNSVLLQDYYSDLALIRQGKTVFKEIDPYTTETVKPTYIHIFYLLLGKVGKIGNISEIALYYLSAYFTLAIFLIFVNLLVSQVVPKGYRLLCLLIIYFASPFPPINLNIFGKNIFIGEGWWTSMNVYSRFLLRPLHFAGITILVACTYFFILFWRSRKKYYVYLCAFLCFLGILFSAVPELIFLASLFLIALIILLSSITNIRKYSAFSQKIISAIGLILLISFPAILFVISQTNSSFIGSVISNWEYNNFKKEDFYANILVYLTSYGLLLPFSLLALPKIIKKMEFEKVFILILTAMPIIFYLLSINGILRINKLRFAYSAPYVFAGILATYGISNLLSVIKNILIKKIVWAVIIILLLFNSFLGFKSYWWPNLFITTYPYNTFIPQKYFLLAKYIDKNLPQYSTVMTNFYTGMFIPSFSNVKVFIGHETSTINFWDKMNLSNAFYSSNLSEKDVKNLFKNYNLQYVLWEGEKSQKYAPLLDKLLQIENITFYKIKPF